MIAVIGGGITGLSACYELERLGFSDILLLEKSDRPGGVILTEKVDGFLIEGGPDCLYASKPWALDLSRELGIAEDLIPPREETKGTYILWKGKLHRLPEGFLLLVPTDYLAFFRSGLLSPLGKLRVLLEPFIPPRKQHRDESLRDFVLRRLGREVLDRIAEPLVGGIHGGIPERLSVEAIVPTFKEMERRHGSLLRGLKKSMKPKGGAVPFLTFREGMGELVKGVLEALKGTKVLLGCGLRGLEPQGGRYRLYTDSGEMEAEAVLLAIPSYEASRALEPWEGTTARLLALINHGSSVVLNLAFERKALEGVKGHGFLVPRKERMRIKAVSFSSEKFPFRAPEGRVLLRVFFGADGEDVLQWDDEAILTVALDELSKVLVLKERPILWRLYRWPKGMAQMEVGHRGLVADIRKGLVRYKGLLLAGSSYDGIGIGDCVRSGREAARVLARQLLGR